MGVRLRFEYRKMLEQNTQGLKEVHVVYDTWYDKVRTTLSSKYACKQYIKRNQEEVDTEDE